MSEILFRTGFYVELQTVELCSRTVDGSTYEYAPLAEADGWQSRRMDSADAGER